MLASAFRVAFGGAYAVDNFALVLKALFLVAGYVTVLLSTNYIAEGDYAEGEYYFLLLASILGMTVMASARDLITIFVALEMLSIPAYLLAGWRKRDRKGNEAGVKYYLMGVFASGILLYGMSLMYGLSGTTNLRGIATALAGQESDPRLVLAVILVVAGIHAGEIEGKDAGFWFLRDLLDVSGGLLRNLNTIPAHNFCHWLS